MWPGPIFYTCAENSFRFLNQSDLSDLTLSMGRVTEVLESRTSGVGPSHRSRFLGLTKRSGTSEDEND